MHRKKCKARCIKCKRVFVTTNIDKLFMRHNTCVICNHCQDAFAQSLLTGLLEKIMVPKPNGTYKWMEVNGEREETEET